VNGLPYVVVGKIRKKEQDSNYNGPDNNKIFIPFATMMQDMPRRDAPPGAISDIVVAPRQEVIDTLAAVLDQRTGRIADIDWPLEANVRQILSRRHNFDPTDRQAMTMWDTSLQTLMFARMIDRMRDFFTIVGLVTLGLGGIGVMNIMLIAVKDRTREIGVRKALGATTRAIERQFFLEGFVLTMTSGLAGLMVAGALCLAVNTLAPLPIRFSGMIVTWQTGVLALGALVAVGVVTATLPARRAAQLPPTEALRYEA